MTGYHILDPREIVENKTKSMPSWILHSILENWKKTNVKKYVMPGNKSYDPLKIKQYNRVGDKI